MSGSGSGRIIIRGRRGAHAGDGAGAGRGVNVCGSAGVQWLMTCDCQHAVQYSHQYVACSQ